jgi:cation transport regulator ChaB
MPTGSTSFNFLVEWAWDIISYFSRDEIIVPINYHDQIEKLKTTLISDTSGIINSVLDFAIDCASVDLIVETKNPNVTDVIDTWFDKINYSLRGKVPTGLRALEKEYYRERWKNSSFLVLRTQWEDFKIDNISYSLPTKMWFVDGANIIVEDGDKKNRIIGEEKYYIKIDDDIKKPLPSNKDELIFVQKPFSSWSELYPTPFLFQRGIYKNLKLYDLMNQKGERIIAKALEYLLLMKKGSEGLALKGLPEYTYSGEDLQKASEDLQKIIKKTKHRRGTPTYTTNFDTSLEHLIPDYKRAISSDLYAPIEKRILAGLGLVEIVEGTTSTRREGILNPKPFITEVETGVKDFISLMSDVIKEIIDRNSSSHQKYFSDSMEIDLHYPAIKSFVDDSLRQHLRSMYDRGVISKQTYSEVVGGTDFDIEIKRRTQETKDKLDIKMYAPIIDNREGVGIDLPGEPGKEPKLKTITPKPKPNIQQPVGAPKDTIPTSKKGPEAKNFKGEFEDEEEYDGTDTEFLEALDDFTNDYEEAPYKTNKDLPPAVQKHPAGAQKAFREAFNNALEHYKNETTAFKVAWSVLKKWMKNHKGD